MSKVKPAATAESLQALFDAFNRHDVEGVMAFMTDDVVFEGAAGPEVYGTRFEGHNAVAAAFAKVWETLPDVQWRDTRHFVAGDRGVSEWRVTGTNAEGKRIEAQGVDLFRFRDGKIVLKQAFRKDRPLLDPQTR